MAERRLPNEVPVLRERPEVEKLRYALLKLTRLALEDSPLLRAYVLTLGSTLGFTALIDSEDKT